jgi:hypothetical protein
MVEQWQNQPLVDIAGDVGEEAVEEHGWGLSYRILFCECAALLPRMRVAQFGGMA